MLSLSKRLLFAACLMLGCLFSQLALAQHSYQNQVDHWTYRWGDSPFVDGKPVWTEPGQQTGNWQQIAFPTNPPGRQGQHAVWFRTQLNHEDLHQPVLYIYSIDLIAEVYLGSDKIYQFGDLQNDRRVDFIGWPWHMIELPADYADKPLFFRVFSDYTDIGLWGEVKLMEKSDLLLYIISTSYIELLIALFSVFIAILAFAFAMMRGETRHFSYLGGFALVSAISLLAENQAMQLVFPFPLLRTYLAAFSYFAMPIFISLLLASWSTGRARRLALVLVWVHLLYLLGAAFITLSGYAAVASTFPWFDGLFAVTLLLMLAICAINARQAVFEQQMVMAAFTLFALLLIVDMAVAHGLLPWSRVEVSWGALSFSVVLALVSLRHYSHVQQALRELNEHLEVKVRERTSSLHAYAETEQKRAQALALENHFNTALAELNAKLQACQDFEEAREIIQSQLPSLFTPAKVSLLLSRSDDNRPLPGQLIVLQEIGGGSTVFASVMIEKSSELLSREKLKEFISRANQRLAVTLSSIKLREELQRFSFEDALTGLQNRRFFDEALIRDIQLARRNHSALSLLMCDIDHFKRFNDEYGHDAGDAALQTVATELKKHFRESDIPCRFGGEEFVVLMRDAGTEAARLKAETLRRDIEAININYQQRELAKLTVSIGIASLSKDISDAETLLREADKALYRAKQQGRNRVETDA